jgi:hypothetical protein
MDTNDEQAKLLCQLFKTTQTNFVYFQPSIFNLRPVRPLDQLFHTIAVGEVTLCQMVIQAHNIDINQGDEVRYILFIAFRVALTRHDNILLAVTGRLDAAA